jgi:Zn-dependent peptidase ImmA (M78 family)
MRAKTNPRIEAQATELLRRTGCMQVPVPVEVVARSIGLEVEPASLGDDVSGVLVLTDGRGTIGYNEAQAPVRQRFSIAHEIGHYILHQDQGQLFIDKNYTVFLRDQRSAIGQDVQEIQANQFAAALLMPAELIRQEIVDIGFDLGDDEDDDGDEITLAKLATKFGVSSQAMSFRLANLNLL